MSIFLKTDEFESDFVFKLNKGQLMPLYKIHTKEEKQLAIFNICNNTAKAIINSFK